MAFLMYARLRAQSVWLFVFLGLVSGCGSATKRLADGGEANAQQDAAASGTLDAADGPKAEMGGADGSRQGTDAGPTDTGASPDGPQGEVAPASARWDSPGTEWDKAFWN
jgi:hypothetical protein